MISSEKEAGRYLIKKVPGLGNFSVTAARDIPICTLLNDKVNTHSPTIITTSITPIT